jgi:hypothetical protein
MSINVLAVLYVQKNVLRMQLLVLPEIHFSLFKKNVSAVVRVTSTVSLMQSQLNDDYGR